MEEALYTQLTGYSALAALVGVRVYPLQLPEGGTLPAVTYQRISGLPVRRMGGNVTQRSERYSFSAWAGTFDEARNVALQLFAALDWWSGVVGTVTVRFTAAEFGPQLAGLEGTAHQHVVEATIWRDA